ncbi:MAG: tyrosine-type recombinase/integrase, partial [bacterium]|nr:tyrosine-type recombinase/integrase [bacterium]
MKGDNWSLEPSKYLSKEEVSKLLVASKDRIKRASARREKVTIRDFFIIDLGLSTGLRVMEMAALKCGDLFLEHSVPFLLVRKGKGGKRRIVYFNGQFKKHCGEDLMWKKNAGEPMGADDPLLRSDASGGHLTTRAIQKTFKRCAQTAGLSLAFSIHC